jgi:hypothetical protein
MIVSFGVVSSRRMKVNTQTRAPIPIIGPNFLGRRNPKPMDRHRQIYPTEEMGRCVATPLLCVKGRDAPGQVIAHRPLCRRAFGNASIRHSATDELADEAREARFTLRDVAGSRRCPLVLSLS